MVYGNLRGCVYNKERGRGERLRSWRLKRSESCEGAREREMEEGEQEKKMAEKGRADDWSVLHRSILVCDAGFTSYSFLRTAAGKKTCLSCISGWILELWVLLLASSFVSCLAVSITSGFA